MIPPGQRRPQEDGVGFINQIPMRDPLGTRFSIQVRPSGYGSANFRKSGPTQRARPWTPRRLRDIFLPPRSNRWSSSSGPALNAPRSLLPTILSSSCESVLLTSTADDPERSVLKSASCFSFSAGNTWSPSATYVPGDTVSPSLPTTSSVVKSTCVRNVVRTCLTAFAYISTPARCFLLKSSQRLRWQDRQHKSW